jgi:putative endopeptidase
MKMKNVLSAMAVASLTIACGPTQPKSGIDLANLNQEVKPSEDFYEFACGGWMKNHPLPAAYSRYGSFDKLGEDNNKRINDILNELKNNQYEDGTTERKLSDLYKLSIDSVRRNADGIKPVLPIIEKMETAKSVDELFAIELELAPYGNTEFFGAYIGADDKNSTQNILNIMQGGITLGLK